MPNFRTVSIFTALCFGGFLALLMAYLFKNANQESLIYAQEFTPVFIMAFCFMYLCFTCGEYVGLLKAIHRDNERLTTYGMSSFFVLTVLFYYLRAGFSETPLERIFFIGLPLLMTLFLMGFTFRLKVNQLMPSWYYQIRQTLLFCCLCGIAFAGYTLFYVVP